MDLYQNIKECLRNERAKARSTGAYFNSKEYVLQILYQIEQQTRASADNIKAYAEKIKTSNAWEDMEMLMML